MANNILIGPGTTVAGANFLVHHSGGGVDPGAFLLISQVGGVLHCGVIEFGQGLLNGPFLGDSLQLASVFHQSLGSHLDFAEGQFVTS